MSVFRPESGSRRPELGAFATNRSMALPFLPTLLTALVIGSLSLLCRQPSQPASAEREVIELKTAAATLGEHGFHGSGSASDSATPIPAAVAFGRLYPPTAASLSAATPARPLPRLAAASRRVVKRAEPVRGVANPPRPQAEPAAPSPAPEPFREVSEPDVDALPEGAIPFAPTAASFVDTARALGSDAATLGSSVLGSLALPR